MKNYLQKPFDLSLIFVRPRIPAQERPEPGNAISGFMAFLRMGNPDYKTALARAFHGIRTH